MGAFKRHSVLVAHLTDHRAIDIINCNHHNNSLLVEDYCEKHHISYKYCNETEAVRLLVQTGGAGFGVYTCVDIDDMNECYYRKGIARHSQRELIALLGGWVVIEPIDLKCDIGPENHTIIVA